MDEWIRCEFTRDDRQTRCMHWTDFADLNFRGFT